MDMHWSTASADRGIVHILSFTYMHLKADTGRLFKLHVHNLCGFYNVGGVVLQHLDLTPDLVQEFQSNGVYHKSK